jgi:arylsulfatase A-like enzyme
MLTGLYPPNNHFRGPYSVLKRKTIAETFRENGYKTAGFVGVNLIGSTGNFDSGFDYFDEPRTVKNAWKVDGGYKDGDPETIWGNLFLPRLLDWITENREKPFFVWAHYFECHQAAEEMLIETGRIRKDVMPEFGYMDPKIQYMDEAFFGTIFQQLEDLCLMERTAMVITSDHGTNIGEHPVPPFPDLDLVYPQHTTLYDCDIRIPLIIKSKKIPSGVKVKGMTRGVDIVPTIINLMELENSESFDGIDLGPYMEDGQTPHLTAYSEELFPHRGPGDFQMFRDNGFKYIIDRRNMNEEFYDLTEDPNEQDNMIDRLQGKRKALMNSWKDRCDDYFPEKKEKEDRLSSKQKQAIEKRLRFLGYIK